MQNINWLSQFTSTSLQLTSVDFKFTSVQLNLAQLNSKQLPVSLYDFYCHCHIRDTHLRVVTWDHRTKYPLDKGRAGPQSL